jgi:hypothetical protein
MKLKSFGLQRMQAFFPHEVKPFSAQQSGPLEAKEPPMQPV